MGLRASWFRFISYQILGQIDAKVDGANAIFFMVVSLRNSWHWKRSIFMRRIKETKIVSLPRG